MAVRGNWCPAQGSVTVNFARMKTGTKTPSVRRKAVEMLIERLATLGRSAEICSTPEATAAVALAETQIGSRL